jgi:predicted nucleic acid-binding protein
MIVADASVATKWFIQEQGRNEARALLESEPEIVAPEFIVAEILNAACRNVRTGRIIPEEMKAIAAAPPARFFAQLFPLAPLAAGATEISLSLDHPVYDRFYIALAQREQIELVTADDRLYRKTRRTGFSKIVRKLA